mmetsp:Transcript_11300/g.24908  ORF Transcript_11300/g.24908 Transcript_11300/m.24908 type:complete len:215 (+) Transcript_11300:231-875(+)
MYRLPRLEHSLRNSKGNPIRSIKPPTLTTILRINRLLRLRMMMLTQTPSPIIIRLQFKLSILSQLIKALIGRSVAGSQPYRVGFAAVTHASETQPWVGTRSNSLSNSKKLLFRCATATTVNLYRCIIGACSTTLHTPESFSGGSLPVVSVLPVETDAKASDWFSGCVECLDEVVGGGGGRGWNYLIAGGRGDGSRGNVVCGNVGGVSRLSLYRR